MTKPQSNSTWLELIYQSKNVQTTIFTGFPEILKMNPMTIVIDSFVNYINLSCLKNYKYNDSIGGRPSYNYETLLKLYLYALYHNISLRKLKEYYFLGSDLHFLSQEYTALPNRNIFTSFLKDLDNYIDKIFDMHLEYLSDFISLNFDDLYCDGTTLEAHNNRHKIITDTNIKRSNTKWETVLNSPNSTNELKQIAKEKLKLNIERTQTLEKLKRSSYGRTDNDCVILKDKNGAFIAGYNVQFVEEHSFGLIVYQYISNKNPDSSAFLDIIEPLVTKFHPKRITLDTGYGIPEIITKLKKLNVEVFVKALKNENATKKITEYSFELSDGEDYLICPAGQMLEMEKTLENKNIVFKAHTCSSCEKKSECLKNKKTKRITINLEEFKNMKHTKELISSKEGQELYSHRANRCESPHGFIKYNLNGKKLQMNGLERNHTIVVLYSILYNLRRLISIKMAQDTEMTNY